MQHIAQVGADGASDPALSTPSGRNRTPPGMRHRVIESLLALAASTAAGQTANTVSILLLAAILSPADFGAISLGTVITTAATVARNAFVFQTLIHRSTRVRESADQIALVSLMMGAILCGALWFAAPQVSTFFNAPQATDLLRLMALAFLMDSIGTVPDTLFEKELRFRRKMWLEISKPTVVAIVSVALAMAGVGPTCVGWAQLISYTLWTLGLYAISEYRPRPRWDPRLLGELLNYGRYVLAGSLLVFFFTNLDNASVARLLGARALGYYAFAFLLGYFPAKVLTDGVVASVVLPVFSKVQHSREGQARAVLTTFRYVGYYAAPLCVMTIVLGPAVLQTVYGHKWTPAYSALQILAVYGFAHTYFLLTRNFCNGTGRAPVFWRISGLQLALPLPFIVAAPSRFGIEGTAGIFTAGKVTASVVAVSYVTRVTRLRPTKLMGAIIRPALIALAAGVVANGVLTLTDLQPHKGQYLDVAPALGAFCLIYLVICFATDAKIRAAPGLLLRRLRGKQRGRVASEPIPAPVVADAGGAFVPRRLIPVGDGFDLQDSRVLWRASLWRAYLQAQDDASKDAAAAAFAPRITAAEPSNGADGAAQELAMQYNGRRRKRRVRA